MDITSLITKSGKTRKEIINDVGISQAYLSLIEAGKRDVGIKYVAPLADALGVKPVDLRPDLFAALSIERFQTTPKQGDAA